MPDPLHVQQLIAAIPCRIELPEAWGDFFERTGPLSSAFEDERRFRRFHMRRPAALRYKASLPGLPRAEKSHQIYLKDICRASVAFIHSEQLFPREQVELLTGDGSVFRAVVVRCVRHQTCCYEIAAVFNAVAEAGDTAQSA